MLGGTEMGPPVGNAPRASQPVVFAPNYWWSSGHSRLRYCLAVSIQMAICNANPGG